MDFVSFCENKQTEKLKVRFEFGSAGIRFKSTSTFCTRMSVEHAHSILFMIRMMSIHKLKPEEACSDPFPS